MFSLLTLITKVFSVGTVKAKQASQPNEVGIRKYNMISIPANIIYRLHFRGQQVQPPISRIPKHKH